VIRGSAQELSAISKRIHELVALLIRSTSRVSAFALAASRKSAWPCWRAAGEGGRFPMKHGGVMAISKWGDQSKCHLDGTCNRRSNAAAPMARVKTAAPLGTARSRACSSGILRDGSDPDFPEAWRYTGNNGPTSAAGGRRPVDDRRSVSAPAAGQCGRRTGGRADEPLRAGLDDHHVKPRGRRLAEAAGDVVVVVPPCWTA
jgi:hypothetical protein